MNQSDIEEDFHSADEDGFDEEEAIKGPKQGEADKKDKQCNDKVISKESVEPVTSKQNSSKDNSSTEPIKISRENSQKHESSNLSKTCGQDVDFEEKEADEEEDENVGEDEDEEEEEEDEDEDALAERIRERNLKIARKFSAEIARSLRASAPIPVNTKNSPPHEFSENSYPMDHKSSIQPPAPPSTPALSSSFNNLSDQTPLTTGTSSATNTQYGWRMFPKVANQQSSSGTSSPSKNTKPEDQARSVLDKLSEKLSQNDKSLFERVAADIKKVSINDEESQTTTTTDTPSALTSITDLGSTLGGWGWNGATKLLSSASQVTSQVSSVLDSVVGVSVPDENDAINTRNKVANKTASNDAKSEQAPVDITYNDPLVDLTLNAMETLGKKAFEVMTTRDETGSLQIKGLGRPWEHLLNTKKSEQSSRERESHPQEKESYSPREKGSHSPQENESYPPREKGSHSPREKGSHSPREKESHSPPPEFNQVETWDTSSISTIQSDSSHLPSTLKLRKRRNND
jgi:hypothetical protein